MEDTSNWLHFSLIYLGAAVLAVPLARLAAERELLTFQRGSQPHVALLDLFRQAKLEPKRVHAVSSISAMTQLAEGGFGVLPDEHQVAARLARKRQFGRLLDLDSVAEYDLAIEAFT